MALRLASSLRIRLAAGAGRPGCVRPHLPQSRQVWQTPRRGPQDFWRTGATGITAGCLGSLVGLGGGFIAVPMMTSWVGISQHLATGSSLAVVLMTGSSGAFGYIRHGQIDYEVAMAIALGGMIFARAGAKLMANTDAARLKLYMGMLQVAVSPLIPLKAHFSNSRPVRDEKRVEAPRVEGSEDILAGSEARAGNGVFDAERFAKMFVVGSLAGFLSGMFGVGGGALTVPAIALSTSLPQHAVVGTSLLAMLPPAVVGTAVNLANGNISLAVAGPLAAGSFLGGCLGSLGMAPLLPEVALQMLFAVLMASVGARTIFTARRLLAAAGPK